MKKPLLASLLAAISVAPALAQSNVVMYGLADAGVQVSNFGNGHKINLTSGLAEGSRLGFRGNEDLGGGYRALFTLEARIELDNGTQQNGLLSSNANQNITEGLSAAGNAFVKARLPVNVINSAGALFDRQAFVGLGTPYGMVLLGRQYTPGVEIFALSDVFELGTSGTWLNLVPGTPGVFTPGIALRANQALQYRLQLPNGVGATAMYGFNNTGSLNLARRFAGGSLRYKGHGLEVGVGYNREQDQVGNQALTTLTAGGYYTVGDAKIFAGFHRMKNDYNAFARALAPGLSVPGDAATLFSNLRLNGDLYSAGVQYMLGAGRVMAGISHVNDKLASNGDATLFGLGYDHFLSKRTDVYAVVAHVVNQGAAQFALGGSGYFGGSTSQRGQDGNSLQLGIRHRF
ncbi:porin [Pseudoduganella namucuonensis]|uniref:Outer membrane protein (Porin) n=1 Tax=Pseudoduganella namucuonensis TaxID=1035707 RepID=A0A1I7LRS0_9BURK|nr:porin [Pseudoduganella namucuonensis]SFV12412.1 Outer membrane protein (porin) [Pseudoduganella namucuonensis]